MKNHQYKNIFSALFLLLFCATSLYAQQAPQAFKYQAVVRDANGYALSNQAVAMRINLLMGGEKGNIIYSETHTTTTSSFGLVNLEIGRGTPEEGNFSNIDWGEGQCFIQIELDKTGGTNYQLMGTSQLLSVPYAFYSVQSGGSSTFDVQLTENKLIVNNGDTEIDFSKFLDNTDAQTLSIEGNQLSISNGNTIELPSNSIELLAEFNEESKILSLGNGIMIDLSVLGNDDQNELIQSVELAGTVLKITDASGTKSIDLTELKTIENTSNELQQISKEENLISLSQEGGEIVLNDDDAHNELLLDAQLEGSILQISDAGGTKEVDLSSLQEEEGNELVSDILLKDNVLTVKEGGNEKSIDLTELVNDKDADPENELQDLSAVLLKGNNAAGKTIENLGTPRNSRDAVTKDYVDKVRQDIKEDDGDKSSTNELQVLSKSGNEIKLSRGGGTVSLNDDDASNELLTNVELDGTSLKITDAGGTQIVDVSSLVEDADADSDNEIQDLNLTTNILKVTNNTAATDIDLTSYLDNTDEQDLSNVLGRGNSAGNVKITDVVDPTTDQDVATKKYVDDLDGNDTDKSITNELLANAELEGTNFKITDAGGTQIVDVSSLVEDADADPDNEIQDLNLTTNILKVTNNIAATDIDLTSYLDNTDEQDLANVLGRGNSAGNVKITNVVDPTTDQDVATKKYVDDNEVGTFKLESGVVKNAGTDYSDDFVFGSPTLDHDGHNLNLMGRMFFDKSKKAFRAGGALGTAWNEANLGASSIGLGHGTVASGMYSTAMGLSSKASGESSTAMGSSSMASGEFSTAMGRLSIASGESSTAMGNSTTAKSYAETAIGVFNTNYTPISVSSFNAHDRLFVVGNGTSDDTRSDALTILKNGNTNINGTVSLFGIALPSDKRLKKDITPLNNSLSKILSLQGVNYYWKKAPFDTQKLQTGFIAQELQTIIPELVYTKPDGFLSVDYVSLIPILTEAIKEQQKIIEALKAENKQLKVDVSTEKNNTTAQFEALQAQIDLLKQAIVEE